LQGMVAFSLFWIVITSFGVGLMMGVLFAANLLLTQSDCDISVRAASLDLALPANPSAAADNLQRMSRRSVLADGCTKVYLDVGSNIGVQVRKLFQPELYKEAPILPIFDIFFGSSDERTLPSAKSGLCAFGFEANPEHAQRLRELEAAYVARGWRVKFFVPRAVTDSEGDNVTFYTNAKESDHNWGGSMTYESRIRGQPASRAFNVTSLDLATFLEQEVMTRVLFPGVTTDRAVMMKMDIEGSEFAVLPKLLQRNLLCAGVVDALTVEWHARYHKSGVRSVGAAAIRDLAVQLDNRTRCRPRRVAEWFKIDDESYHLDSQPLPSKSQPLERLPLSEVEVD